MEEENKVQSPEMEAPQEEDQTLDTEEVSEDTSPDEGEHQHEEEQEDITTKYERLSGKVSKLESTASAYEKQISKYNQWVLQSEARTREYLEAEGLQKPDVDRAIAQIREKRPDLWQSAAQQKEESPGQSPVLDPRRLKEEIKQEMQVEQYVTSERQKFFQEVPEMHPDNYKDVSEEDRELIRDFANRVDYLANSLMQTQDLSYSQALKMSYDTLVKAMGGETVVNSEREAGRIEGMAEALADEATTFSPGGSEPGKPNSVALSENERDIVSRLPGMTPEAYAKYKR